MLHVPVEKPDRVIRIDSQHEVQSVGHSDAELLLISQAMLYDAPKKEAELEDDELLVEDEVDEDDDDEDDDNEKDETDDEDDETDEELLISHSVS